MTLEQDDAHAIWQAADDTSWDSAFDYDDVPSTQYAEEPLDSLDESDIDRQSATTSFLNSEALQRFGRQFSPVLIPLPFALLIFLITFVVGIKEPIHLQPLPLAILLLALAVMQGTMLYYAGSNEDLWLLCMIFGYSLFLLVGTFAIFNALGAVILLIILLLLLGLYTRRGFRSVPEGNVDIVYSFGRYARTLFPGPRFVWPWETDIDRLSVREKLWKCPVQEVNISRDQGVRLAATISYQLLSEDAYLAFAVESWEESLHTLFVGTLQSMINHLSPEDFIAWPQSHHSRTPVDSASMDPMLATRWDRINDALASRIQDRVAAWGIQVNWVRVQDITLIPHLTPVTNPPPGATTQPRQVDIGGTGATRGSAPASPPLQAQVLSKTTEKPPQQSVPPIAPAPPDATTTTMPTPIKAELMIESYNAVREGRITDPETIRGLARRFESIANDPDVSKAFDYDAGRAAATLYRRADVLEQIPKRA